MAVVVDQREDTTAARRAGRHRQFAVALEAPADTAELTERGNDGFVRCAEFVGYRDRSQGVAHVVLAGQVERHVERLLALAQHAEAHAVAFGPDIDRTDLGIFGRGRR